MSGRGGIYPRIEWKRSTPRSDFGWACAFVAAIVLWAVAAAIVIGSVNVDSSFSPVGSLASEMNACKQTKSFVNGAQSIRKQLQAKSAILTTLNEHKELPIAALAMVFCLSWLWLVSLQKCGFITVWGTMLVKSTALVVLAYRFDYYGFTSLYHMCLFGGLGLLLLTLWQYKRINLTARILNKVGQSLQEGGWSMWLALMLVQVSFMVVFVVFSWVGFSSLFVWELRRTESGMCVLSRSGFSRNLQVFSAIIFLWISAYLRAAKLLVVAAPSVCWYFPFLLSDGQAPESPAFAALGWACSTSAGTLSIAGAISAIAEKAEQAANSRSSSWVRNRLCCCCATNCFNPLTMLLQLIWYLLESCLITGSRFAVVGHLFLGEGFFVSAVESYRTLGLRGAIGGYVVNQAGESVVSMGAYVFSLVIGLVAWEYVDSMDGFHTLVSFGRSVGSEVLFYVLVMLYLLLTYYPTVSIILALLIADVVPDHLTPFLCGVFVACASHLIFGFVGEVILGAADTIYFCYCIDKKQAKAFATTRGPSSYQQQRLQAQEQIQMSQINRNQHQTKQNEVNALLEELEAMSDMPEPSAPPLDDPIAAADDRWHVPAWSGGAHEQRHDNHADVESAWQRTSVGGVPVVQAHPVHDNKTYNTF